MLTYQQLQQAGCENSKGKINSNWIKSIKNTPLEIEIIQTTNFLPEDTKLNIRIYAIKYNITYHPKCYCGNPVMFNPTKRYNISLFSNFCSLQCATQSIERLQKTKLTNIKKYGHEFHQLTEQGKKQRQQTNLKKYGYITPAKNPQIREQIKQTNMIRYGHYNVFGSEYGKEKIREINLKKYGNQSFTTSTLNNETILKLNDPEWLKQQNHILKKSLKEISDELNCSIACVHQHFQKYDISVQRHSISSFEKQIKQFLIDLNIDVLPNKKINGISYDLIIPTHNLIIECNGIYWHSEFNSNRGKYYHLEKTINAETHGYQLIHIFENEWVYKQPIVKSILLHKLQKTNKIVYARNTTIKQLSNQYSKKFLEENHIQGGNVQNNLSYGLFYNEELLALLTLCKSRFDSNKQTHEITRFCIKRDYHIPGAFDKLFKHVIKNHNEIQQIVTFADRRWSNGNTYKKIFTFIGNTEPSYYYFKTNNCLKLFNRMQFQKHKLPTILEKYDASLTEWENMINNGYDRIWDCGNTKWLWKRK